MNGTRRSFLSALASIGALCGLGGVSRAGDFRRRQVKRKVYFIRTDDDPGVLHIVRNVPQEDALFENVLHYVKHRKGRTLFIRRVN